jgi:XapX domain-containing protein
MGVIFAVMRLPIPAPPTLAGVVGVLGVFIGYRIVRWLL